MLITCDFAIKSDHNEVILAYGDGRTIIFAFNSLQDANSFYNTTLQKTRNDVLFDLDSENWFEELVYKLSQNGIKLNAVTIKQIGE